MKKKIILGAGSLALLLIPALAFANTETVEAAAEAVEESSGLFSSPIFPNLTEFIPMLIAFAIVAFVLMKFGWPVILKALDERAETIEGSLKKAEEAKIEAENVLSDSQAKLTEARKESAGIVESGKSAGEATRAEVIAKAEAEAAAIIERGRTTVEAERSAALAEVKAKSADLAIAIASKVLGEKVTAEVDAALIDKAIAEMGSFNG